MKIKVAEVTNKIYILDDLVMRNMIEGDVGAEKVLAKLLNNKMRVMTTSSALLRAIYLSKPNVIIKNIKNILKITEICGDNVDFKDHTQVSNKLTEFASQTENI